MVGFGQMVRFLGGLIAAPRRLLLALPAAFLLYNIGVELAASMPGTTPPRAVMVAAASPSSRPACRASRCP